MNRLIRIMLSIILSFFCLFINVSYAGIISPSVTYAVTNTSYDSPPSNTYTDIYSDINTACPSYMHDFSGMFRWPDSEVYPVRFENIKNHIYSTYDMNSYLVFEIGAYDKIIFYNSNEIDVGVKYYGTGTDKMDLYMNISPGDRIVDIPDFYNNNGSVSAATYLRTFNTDAFWRLTYSNGFIYPDTKPLRTDSSIKQLTSGIVWDGTSYYYKVESDEPPIVEDLQLKKIIDELFTSNTFLSFPDSWRNNFFIIYNKSSNTYEIIIAPDYVYFRGYKYLKDESNYYRMLAGSSPTFNITDFSNLVNNAYTEYTNPLGSFNFYKFVYECDEEGNVINRYNRTFNNMISDKTEYLTENEVLVYTRRNIPFYTLNDDGSFSEDTSSSLPSTELKDENGDVITIIPPKQPQDTIVDNADFDSLSDSFEENKDLFSFTENMQWLIKANNKLSNYFLGFIVMCALFITLGRVLKG